MTSARPRTANSWPPEVTRQSKKVLAVKGKIRAGHKDYYEVSSAAMAVRPAG